MNNITADNQLNDYLESIALEIAEQASDADEIQDLVHEAADGCEHVIYYHKAHSICQHCDISNGEQFIEDMGGFTGDAVSYDTMATQLAYGEIYTRLASRALDLYENEE